MDLDELIIANEACASKLIEGIYATSSSEKEVREKYSLLNECERLVIANFIADQIGRDRENYDLDNAGLQNAIDLWHMKEDGIL